MKASSITCLALAATWLALNPPSSVGAGGAPPAPAAAGGKVMPLVTFTGVDSRATERAQHRVTSDEQWRRIWDAHRGPDAGRHPRPQVDFGRCTLVALFQGKTSNTSELEVDSVTETSEVVLVRCNFPGYATAGNVEPHEVTPYGFIVLPKTDKPIVVEHDVGSGKTDPPTVVWKEAARLAASK